jgi:acyl-coenzyme A thioesterase PaaI-like protein
MVINTTPHLVLPPTGIGDGGSIRALIDQMLGEIIDLGLDPDATPANTKRNPKFARAAKLWLKDKRCIVCGGRTRLQAHHKYPFHLFPSLEMDERYWRPLCEGDHRLNCHLLVGHGGDFSGFNPLVDEVAGIMHFILRTNGVLLHAIREQARRENPPRK